MSSENYNKKLMVLTVGVGGTNGEDIAHGLFFSIKNQNPDCIVLIASSESYQKTFPQLKKKIDDWGRSVQIEEQRFEEINDFELLHNKYLEAINNYIKRGYRKTNIVVDYTSGTKAMSAALVSAAITAEVGSISYIYGEREGGRVKSGTERSSSITPNSIFSSRILNKFISFFNYYRYESALALLKDYEIYPRYSLLATALTKVAEFFSMWDKFNFKNAFEQLRSINDDELKIINLKTVFDKTYKPLLATLKVDELSQQKIDDLVFNARRRAEEGKYDDAVARLYRTIEMIGQLEFKKEFNISTEGVNLDDLPDRIRNKAQKILYPKRESYNIGSNNSFRILALVNNPVSIIYKKNYEALQKHLIKRNNSILAHGSSPISRKDLEEFIDFVIELFTIGPKGNLYPDFKFPQINISL